MCREHDSTIQRPAACLAVVLVDLGPLARARAIYVYTTCLLFVVGGYDAAGSRARATHGLLLDQLDGRRAGRRAASRAAPRGSSGWGCGGNFNRGLAMTCCATALSVKKDKIVGDSPVARGTALAQFVDRWLVHFTLTVLVSRHGERVTTGPRGTGLRHVVVVF